MQDNNNWSNWPKFEQLEQSYSFDLKNNNNNLTKTPATTTTPTISTSLINNLNINCQSDSDSCTSDAESTTSTTSSSITAPPSIKYDCLLCSHFEFESRTILEHIFNQHKLIIADVNQIVNLSGYLTHWKKQMLGKPLTEYTTVVQTQVSKTDNSVLTNYYLLSDILPQDQDIRRKLQTDSLNSVLEQQHLERIDSNFSCICPMCPMIFKGDRSNVTTHLIEQHSFNIGLSDNLVNLKELLQILKEKCDSIQCLYCEKTFKSTSVLKLHMKKKKHNRLNPTNTIYDKYYLLNYLEPGKNWEDMKKDNGLDIDDDDNKHINNLDIIKQAHNENNGNHQITHWDDWTEGESDNEFEETAICLFCDSQFNNSDCAFEHMNNIHNFDFDKKRKLWNLDYYESMKLLNFIRRTVVEKICCNCGDNSFNDKQSLYNHLDLNQHCDVLKENPIWRDVQFLFPTFENDNILTNFEGFDESENQQYLEEELEYQSNLIEEMQQNRDDILKKLNESNITL